MNKSIQGVLILVVFIELGLILIDARALDDDISDWAGSTSVNGFHDEPYGMNELMELALLQDVVNRMGEYNDEPSFAHQDHFRPRLSALRPPTKKSLDLVNRWRPLAGPIPVDTRSRPEYTDDIVSAVQRDSSPGHRPLRFG